MVLAIFLLAALCLPVGALEVTANGEPPARCTWVRDAPMLTISYLHSVERTPIEESYQVGVAGLRLREMRWQSFGSGLPDEYDRSENGFYVRSMDVGLGRRLEYWFLPLNDVRIVAGTEMLFQGPAEPSRVSIRVRLVPLFVAAWS